MLLRNPPAARRPIAVVPVGEAAATAALQLAVELRGAGHVVELGYGGNLGKRMKRANKLDARAAVIIGTDELARDAVTRRDLDCGEQEEVPLAALRERLIRFR